MTKSAKRFRSVLCGLLSFLLSVSLVLLCVLGVIRLTVLNPSYVAFICDKSGYSQATWSELKEEFVSYGAACNIDESFFDGVFENIITPQRISEYTVNGIENFYSSEQQEKASTEQLDGELLEALKSYAEEKGFALNDSLIENLQVMSGEMCEIYLAFADMFNSSYFNTASNMLNRYIPLFKLALIGIGIFALLTIIVIRLFFGKAKNYLRYYIYATAGAALMLAVGPAAVLILNFASKINIMNASMYNLATGLVNGFFWALLLAAAVMALLTVILAVIRIIIIKKHEQPSGQ